MIQGGVKSVPIVPAPSHEWTPHDPAVLISAPAGNILDCTESFAALLAVDRENLRGRPLHELLAGSSQRRLANCVQQSDPGPLPLRESLTFLAAGQPLPLQVEFSRLRLLDQEIVLLQCDKSILARHPELGEAELALRAYVLDHLNCGLFVVEPSGRLVTCNEIFAQLMFARSRLSVRGRRFAELEDNLPPDKLRVWQQFVAWLANSESIPQEYIDDIDAFGHVVRYRLSGSTFSAQRNHTLIVGSLVDLSAEKLMEQSLQKSERILREIFANIVGGLALISTDEKVELCNEAFARIFGVANAAEFVGRSLLDFIPADQHEKIAQENARRRSGASSTYELSICTPCGKQRVIAVTVKPRYDQTGHFVGTYSNIFDITDRVSVERQFRLLATAVESAAEVIVLTDRSGIIQYVNPAFEQITGYTPSEAIGRSMSILKSGVHGQTFYQELWSTILAGKTWRGRLINRNRHGQLFNEEGSISPVRDARGEISHFVGVKRDMTKEVQLQSQLVQSQKMESLALMAGGIAHDFNNILASIQGNAQIAAERLTVLDIELPEATTIADSCKRGAAIVRSLLTYSRRTGYEPVVIDLAAAIRDMSDLLRYFVGTSNTLKLSLPEHALKVLLDPAALDQIMSNLLLNARDAIGEKRGLVQVALNVQSPNEEFPSGAATLSVMDDGCGIPDESVSKIFDPFFTTKDVGKGTGLGLTNVRSAVSGAGGRIEVMSRLNVGTVFTIFLPLEVHADA